MICRFCNGMTASRRLQLIRLLLISLASIGFLIHVNLVSEQYFRYQTTSIVTEKWHKHVKLQPAALCVRYSDIIDRERLLRETGTSIRQHYDHNLTSEFEDEAKLTLDQVHEYTPAADQFINSCMYRQNEWQQMIGSADDCYKHFTITKFTVTENICYHIQFMPLMQDMDATSASESTFFKSMIYALYLTDIFVNASLVDGIIFNNELPFKSRARSDVLPEFKYQDSVTKRINTLANALFLTPMEIKIRSLEPPYDTKCKDISIPEMFKCKQECLVQEFQTVDRVPGFELLSSRYKLRPLSDTDLANQDFRDIINEMWYKCQVKCISTPCHDVSTRTSVKTFLQPDVNFSITVLTPTDSDRYITFRPTMSFIDFFSFVCSCFGTWFGLSFFTSLSFTSSIRLKLSDCRTNRKHGFARRNCQHRQCICQSFVHRKTEATSLHN